MILDRLKIFTIINVIILRMSISQRWPCESYLFFSFSYDETLNLSVDVNVGRPTKINHNIIIHFVCYAAGKLTVTTTVPIGNIELS
jgi:hypothetical protein